MKGLATIVAVLGSLAIAVSQETPAAGLPPVPTLPPTPNVDDGGPIHPGVLLPYDPSEQQVAPAGVASAPQGPRPCVSNDNCPPSQGCSEGHCVDPCHDKPCGNNTFCEVNDHVPSCICGYGFQGDPAEGCTDVEPTCTKDEDCGGEGLYCHHGLCLPKACQGKKCGESAFCDLDDKGVAFCMCLSGLPADESGACPPVPLSAPTKVESAPGGYNNCSGRNFPKPIRRKGYFVVTSAKMNWHNAYMYCVSHGRRLATVNNEKENIQIIEDIRRTGKTNEMFYTSGNDYVNEGRFMWMTTGLPITEFTYFHTGRPSGNIYYNCIAYYNYANQGLKWWDELCTTHHYFVCEDYY